MHRYPAVLVALAFTACGTPDIGGFGQVDVRVNALTLDGVTEAVYAITVLDDAGNVLWNEASVSSGLFGNGPGGDITYIGPCDATDRTGDGVSTNTAVLRLLSLPPLAASEWVDPGSMALTFTCTQNADTPVEFNVTILRPDAAGFVDLAVNLDAVTCAAKVDCVDANGNPLELVQGPTGDRLPSLVFATTCAADVGADPHLYAKPPVLDCANGVFVLDNTAIGTQPTNVFGAPQSLTTAGIDAQDDLERLYWNFALGFDVNGLGQLGACQFKSEVAVSTGPLPGGTVAGGAVPVLTVDVPVTDSTGNLVCGLHPLLGGNGVGVRYAAAGEQFPIQLDGDLSSGNVTIGQP